ncbi:MAG: Sugar transferase involved in LPS biosynthesis (colanic, teichoic acid) [Chloroflexi bacterium]|jgi:lipopolysaccharide/colanic/teichoic acid biosynthesis glycosyltransferase|nr:MAG: Sugar transferase involved in LPS biosynthesis (colanic, teichoic acid) [Chloroflexota bacterium]
MKTIRVPYKRTFDLVVLITSHLVMAPLWLLLWTVIPLLIKIGDGGPVFYSQYRAGKYNKPFLYRKFRTMVPNAENIGLVWTTSNDPRITPIGKFLRKTAMDELPGVLSIWLGDMSLVGPRALPCREQEILEKEIKNFDDRLKVAPGLTGLSQVYNKEDENNLKLRLDIQYIETMTVVLDIKLILISVKNTILARWDGRDGKKTTD